MRRKVFGELKLALEDALSYERGGTINLRVAQLPPPARRLAPKQIRQIRSSLNASQALFARLLNVSPNTVESWEQGIRHPRQAALKLLAIARNHPEVLLEK